MKFFLLIGALLSISCAKALDPVVRASDKIEVLLGEFESHVIESEPSTRVTYKVDKSAFKPPAGSNKMLDFGYLQVTQLTDTSLNVCGTNGKTHCNKAILQVFTTGVAGSGMWNAAESYGMPVFSTLTKVISVGLGAANAAVMQTVNLPATKRRVNLADFTPTPRYKITSDFTDAGAGTYATTIVVQYALSL